MAESSVFVSESEAWTVDDLLRHTWTEEGRNVGRGLLIKVFAILREFESRRNSPNPPPTLPIALTEEESWALDYHIRRTYVDPTGTPVGRQLLLKVFGALLSIRNAEAVKTLRLPEVAAACDDPGLRHSLDDLRDFLDRGDGGGATGA